MNSGTVSDLGERALIERITARLALPSWVIVGPGDDAAVIEPVRGALDVLTTDAQVEGIHFDRRFVPADAIGHRALAVNLSDLAAMGAKPRVALLSLMLPATLDVSAVDGILDGMLSLAAAHGVALVGGNITGSPGPLIVDVTAMGAVHPRRVLRRTGARPGDDVYVTGSIGDAAVGLRSLQDACGTGLDASQAPHEQKYLRPLPRVRAGLLLGRNRAASACMDMSDGLADAARQVAAASRVGMAIDAAAVPLSDAVREWHDERGEDAVMAAIAGGDDYELLFTVRPSHKGRLREARRHMGDLTVTRIGVVTKDPRVMIRTVDGERPVPEGFGHFKA